METKAGIRCEVLNVIDKDGGSVVLRIKEMMEHSGKTGKLLAGHVLGIEYFDGREYRPAKEGGHILFKSPNVVRYSK